MDNLLALYLDRFCKSVANMYCTGLYVIFKATPYAASPLSDRACLLSVRPLSVRCRDEMIVGP